MKFVVVPLPLAEANAFVQQHHRHHGRVVGHRFSLGVAEGETIRGVAIIGRPVARMLDDGLTLEITRVATDGAKDACSALYGAARRATFALGFCGSGTTGQVAIQLGRSFVGIELNPAYAELARKRIGGAAPLFAEAVS